MEYPFKVTIGIPVFNVEKYVEKALISALEQDFVLPALASVSMFLYAESLLKSSIVKIES